MHLTLLHGYLLQGTGSNIYVANVARAWCAQGHGVTVVCQDLTAGSLTFVDEYVGPGEEVPLTPPEAGRLRVIVPDVRNLLPVYVMDRYDGFVVKTIPEMSDHEITTHIELTAAALRGVARAGTDRVLANHVLLGPVIAKRGLEGTGVPYDVKIHGSALEYTLVPNPELMPLAIEGLSGAERIFVGSQHVRDRVISVFQSELDAGLFDRIEVVPPGMDPSLFTLGVDHETDQSRFDHQVSEMIDRNSTGRQALTAPALGGQDAEAYHRELVTLGESYDQRAIDADLPDRWPALQVDEPIVLYVGKFLAAKGVGELMLTVPAALARVPKARFVFAGFGSYREHLNGMLQGFADGNRDAVYACAHAGNFVDEADVDRWFRPITSEEADRVTITGFVDHAALSALLPLVSVSVVPSKWPEAFGMVAVEAMAAGVLPLCNYHAGLRDVVDAVQSDYPDLASLMRLDRHRFVEQLPERIETALTRLYPQGYGDHHWRREIGRQLREITVRRFSWSHIAKRLLGQ